MDSSCLDLRVREKLAPEAHHHDASKLNRHGRLTMNYRTHCTSSGAAAPSRAVPRRLAIAAALLAIAGGAHAESGSRICGVLAGAQSHPRENVGFVMKVNKGDNRKCSDALTAALQEFDWAGGLSNKQALNRVWRRARGGKVGPFANKSIFSQQFSLETCENFTWYTSGRRDTDFCVGMPRNKLMVFAGTQAGEFTWRLNTRTW